MHSTREERPGRSNLPYTERLPHWVGARAVPPVGARLAANQSRERI